MENIDNSNKNIEKQEEQNLGSEEQKLEEQFDKIQLQADNQEDMNQITKEIVQNLKGINTNLQKVLSQTKKTSKCTLIAVSKTKPINAILAAYDAGQRHFGENYIEEFVEKYNNLNQSHPDIKWHFIGHIQSNKAKKLIQCVNLNLIETIDSFKLADTINKECGKIEERKSKPLDVLIQVLAQDTEGTKYGVEPKDTSNLVLHIKENCKNLRFRGLMSMGAVGNVEEFREVYQLKNSIMNDFKDLISDEDFIISMGTSNDYEQAIIEGGATQVRLGTTIFGARDYSKK